MPHPSVPVVLASGSPYRRDLLARILPDFDCLTTGADESPLPEESCRDLAARLAGAKARSAALNRPDAIIIGSDQVADLDGIALGKPGDHNRAIQQLMACSGKQLIFHTAVCVIDPAEYPAKPSCLVHIDQTIVQFKTLNPDFVERYLRLDEPYDCAGSFKAELRGLVLMESIDSKDPTAIQGLPMIWLAECLMKLGVPVV